MARDHLWCVRDDDGDGEMIECGNCRGECWADEAFSYELPVVGMVVLCLECGPEENYAELRRTA